MREMNVYRLCDDNDDDDENVPRIVAHPKSKEANPFALGRVFSRAEVDVTVRLQKRDRGRSRGFGKRNDSMQKGAWNIKKKL